MLLLFGQGGWVVNNSKAPVDLVAVYFTSPDRGWVAGDDGYLASTVNGGKTWDKYPLGTTETINEIYFRNDKNGYLVAGRKMYLTKDAGQTWQETKLFNQGEFKNLTPEFICIRFSDKKHGLVIGSLLKKTNDGDDVVDSLVMRSEDGGETWTRIIVPTKKELFHLDVNGNSRAWIVGDKGLILSTTDGGLTWREQVSGVMRALFNVNFRDDNEGFAVGGGGTILKTTDGGGNWQKVNVPFTETFKRVDFADDKNGWIVGHKGSILRSADRGQTWVKQASGTVNDLYGLYMDKKYGCAVGAHGLVIAYQK
ncbi:MAG: YCF48-related protein [Acidobacteriota bacterium]